MNNKTRKSYGIDEKDEEKNILITDRCHSAEKELAIIKNLYLINQNLVNDFTLFDHKEALKRTIDRHIKDKELIDWQGFVKRYEEEGGHEQYNEAMAAQDDFGTQSLLDEAYNLARTHINCKKL